MSDNSHQGYKKLIHTDEVIYVYKISQWIIKKFFISFYILERQRQYIKTPAHQIMSNMKKKKMKGLEKKQISMQNDFLI